VVDNCLKSVVFVMGFCSKVSPLEVRAMADLSTLGSLVINLWKEAVSRGGQIGR